MISGRVEPFVIPEIPSMLAVLILERVAPSVPQPVAEASTSKPARAFPTDLPKTQISSLLPRPDE